MPLPSDTKQSPKAGLIPLKDYLSYMDSFTAQTGWRLPLPFADRIQLLLLQLVARWSWFADRLYIQESSTYGLGYDQVVNYLEVKLFSFGMLRQESLLRTINYYTWRLFHKDSRGELMRLSSGTDFNDEVAMSKSIGEGIERYFVLLEKDQSLKTDKVATIADLKQKKASLYIPSEHHLFTDEQLSKYPYLFKNTTGNIEWVKGCELIHNQVAYIPKQLISKQSQKLLTPKEGMMQNVTTNGMAGWFSKEGAIYRGIFEFIQRDAFIVSWLTKKSLPAISHETIIDEDIQNLLTHLKSAKTEILLLKADSVAQVPTVIVVIFDTGFTPGQVYVTAHTDVTLHKAILSGLLEALSLFYQKKTYELPFDYQPFLTEGVEKRERINLYKGDVWSKHVRQLHSGTYLSYEEAAQHEFVSTSDTEILAEVVQRLSVLGEGYAPYVYEYQHKALKKVGFHVVKCFIPALFPLYLLEHQAPIRSKRLGTYEYTAHADVIARLNIIPHPFP